MKQELMDKIKGGLIVSCQALPDEPLYSSFIMAKMALAAKEGGAVGIRANTVVDIEAIRKEVDLPIIGIIKRVFDGSDVYITPTMEEMDALAQAGVEIIATDATNRIRPNGQTLDAFYKEVRAKYPDILLMADTSTYEEAVHAAELGFDFVGTTLCGYTEYTKGTVLPNINLIKRLVKDLDVPVIAEGGIHTPEELREVIEAGVLCSVVGGAITRPRDITKAFVSALVG